MVYNTYVFGLHGFPRKRLQVQTMHYFLISETLSYIEWSAYEKQYHIFKTISKILLSARQFSGRVILFIADFVSMNIAYNSY